MLTDTRRKSNIAGDNSHPCAADGRW